jgi:outer membrane biosynthesis protein TonB
VDRGRDVFKILKALVAAKELEQKLAPTPTTQQPEKPTAQQLETAPAATQPESSPVSKPEPEPEPIKVSPVEAAVPEPQPTPIQQPEPVTLPRILGIGDFGKGEIDTLFKTVKATRTKGYNRAAFLDELQTYRGTREDFIASILNLIGQNAGGVA